MDIETTLEDLLISLPKIFLHIQNVMNVMDVRGTLKQH